MDNKRLLLATALCFLVLMGWQTLADYMGWVQPPAPAVSVAPGQTDQPGQTLQPGQTGQSGLEDGAGRPLPSEAPRFAPGAGREVTVDTPLYKAVFHSAGGILRSFTLKRYNDVIGPNAQAMNMVSPRAAAVSPLGLLINGQPSWNQGEWAFEGGDLSLAPGQRGTLVFSGVMHGIAVTRTITFSGDDYMLAEDTVLASGSVPALARLGYTLGSTPTAGGGSMDAMNMAWDVEGSLEHEGDVDTLTQEGVQESGLIDWAGIMSNYFLSAVIPDEAGSAVFKARLTEDGVWRAALEKQDISLTPGVPVSTRASWWIGPKDREMLGAAPHELADAINMGWFKFLALPLLWLLTFFQTYVANWGVAILLLTLLIKILFWPLTRKSFKSMESMKKIQPMMKQLQDKYGSDKEALSREMMQLYKTYGVNPMGGCLPILIQMPVFIALYQALLNSIELRHASFITHLPFTDVLWLADLSVKDPFYITPIIMGATMFLQQWLSPAVGDPSQRKIMMIMPAVFTFMFVNFPSGLVLYWLCNNVLSIAQQWWTLRKA